MATEVVGACVKITSKALCTSNLVKALTDLVCFFRLPFPTILSPQAHER